MTYKNIKYCFISHNSVIKKDYIKISKMMNRLNYQNYTIYYGGKQHTINKHVTNIDCDDSYCGLPSKINAICKNISNYCNDIDFIVKLDRSVIIKKLINSFNQLNDYSGYPIKFQNCNWHFNRCNPDHKFYNKKFTPSSHVKYYCSGGFGYILSKKCIEYIAQDDTYNNHVYEDFYVADVLKKNSIEAHYFNITHFLIDPIFDKDLLFDKSFPGIIHYN